MLYRSDNCIQIRSAKNHLVFGLGSSFGGPHRMEFLRTTTVTARDFIRLLTVELHWKDKEKTGLPDLPIQGPR
jgi:hypothetical protein